MLLRITLLVIALFGSTSAQVKAFPLWGELKPGPYSVGYKTIFTRDLSRPALVDQVTAGATQLPGVNRIGRQMQICIWYPAQITRRPSYLRFEEYVFLRATEMDPGNLTEQDKQASRKAFIAGPISRGAAEAKLNSLLRMETAARKNAPAAKGLFPLVIFIHGAPPQQSIMSEYLASHGFVVAAVPSKGSFAYDFDVALSGLETLIRDTEFVMTVARKQPNVDGRKLGLIGMSFGSAAVIGFQTRHPELRAMISLDGGIGEAGVGNLITRTPYFSIDRIKAPLLHLYTPNNPHLDLKHIKSYTQATRYLVTIPRMRHGDFVAYGMLEQFVPQMFGQSPGDTKAGFEWLCRYSLNFLQAYVNGDAAGLTFLQQTARKNGVPENLLQVDVMPAEPATPASAGSLRTN